MPRNTPVIHLDIRNWSQTEPGWVNVSASNGQPYSYRYTGGDDSKGGLVMKLSDGRDTAPLQLDADRRYHLSTPTFTDDAFHQLSWRGQSDYAGAIIDENSAVETAKYTMNVIDTGNGNCNIPCDPPVKNQPDR